MGGERLAGARSPYLAMHAKDPVDWWPWGREAFEEAAREEKMIFLSVGYASCHWCHVMERESFRDQRTAQLLNERCVSIKVDREVRPDVDQLYMDYVVASTGGGGWPMSVFLTPDLVPVFGGTYLPKKGTPDLPSFTEVVTAVTDGWEEDPERAQIAVQGAREFLEQLSAAPAPGEVTLATLENAIEAIFKQADETHGGFGTEPKFPQLPLLDFLADFRTFVVADSELEYMLEKSLTGMLRGGVYDHVGGGMFRYATDDEWLVPHFEKMLYDNALLLSTLAKCRDVGPAEEWRHLAQDTVRWMDETLGGPEGLYCSSVDAETNGVEGATYQWTWDELAAVLSEEEMALAESQLGVTRQGNWRGKNIITRRLGRDGMAEQVDGVLAKLRVARGGRPQPKVVDNLIVSWNAFAARGLIEAGAAFGDDAMKDKGLALLERLLERAVCDGEALHALDDPDVAGVRLVEDFAALAGACLSANEVEGRADMLQAAIGLQEGALRLFRSGDTLYMTPEETELPSRPREQQDNPTPSGSSLTAENAVRLYAATGEQAHLADARAFVSSWWSVMDFAPIQAAQAMAAECRLLAIQD